MSDGFNRQNGFACWIAALSIDTIILPRRDFLKSSSAMALGFLGLARFTHAAAQGDRAIAPYGPLVADVPEGSGFRASSM